jgi:hypothetical protein
MRAKLIYEKFTEESDPIEDMGVGFKGITEFKRKIKEVAKIPEKDLSKMNFRDNAQQIVNLRFISGVLAMFYFQDKYGLDFISPNWDRGSAMGMYEIGKAKIGKWLFELKWSTTMQSIKLTVSDGRGWSGKFKESSNCQSMRSLEQSLLKFSKELGIELPKNPIKKK